jgi:hypothetical protein
MNNGIMVSEIGKSKENRFLQRKNVYIHFSYARHGNAIGIAVSLTAKLLPKAVDQPLTTID